MIALGDLSDALSQEDTCAILYLYTAAPSACEEADAAEEIPFPTTNISRDMDLAIACPKGSIFSSPEDEPSHDGTPLGEVLGVRPTEGLMV